MPSPDNDTDNNNEHYIDDNIVRCNEKIDDPSVVAQTQTATKMLSLFRQMEQKKYEHNHNDDGGLKPLKQFTPPPSDNRRLYENNDSEDDDEYSDEGGEEEEEGEEEQEEEFDNEKSINRYEDEYLKQVRKKK